MVEIEKDELSLRGSANGERFDRTVPDESLLAYLNIDLSTVYNGKAFGNIIFRKYSEVEVSVELKNVRPKDGMDTCSDIFIYFRDNTNLPLAQFLPKRVVLFPLTMKVLVSGVVTMETGYLEVQPADKAYGSIHLDPPEGRAAFAYIYDTIIHYRLD